MEVMDALMVARDLMKLHKLDDWGFSFDRSLRRFGACHHDKKLITLSLRLTQMNPEEQVRQTLLHEIAHALVGKGHSHDWTWKYRAREIGYTGSRCYSSAVVTPPKAWVGTCPNCNARLYRHRRKYLACANCCNKYNNGKFDIRFVVNWKDNVSAIAAHNS